jgi:hypothetical protein
MRGEIQSLTSQSFQAIEPRSLSTIWEAFDRLRNLRNEARSMPNGKFEAVSWGTTNTKPTEGEIDQIDEQLMELAWLAAATQANNPDEFRMKAKILAEFLEEVDDYVETALARSLVSDLT